MKDRRGYGALNVTGLDKRAYRAAYQVFVGPIPPGMFVCHRCDNPPCIRPDHLFLGSAKANAEDRERKGRGNQRRGSQHSLAKLDEGKVAAIRARKGWGMAPKLAAEFGISRSAVYHIWGGYTWKHVDGGLPPKLRTAMSGEEWHARRKTPRPRPPNAKLSQEAVAEIRSTTGNTRMLADKFGVSISTIQETRTRKRYPHR